jgi:hypothetical protein
MIGKLRSVSVRPRKGIEPQVRLGLSPNEANRGPMPWNHCFTSHSSLASSFS